MLWIAALLVLCAFPARAQLISTFADDTAKYNMYGDLRNDDPGYTVTAPIWLTAVRVTLANATTWAIDRYVFNYDWARVSPETWKKNIKAGWEWDADRFGMNFFLHPFSGGMFFNAARANGYTYFESVPFAVLGSLEWEHFGEDTRPSYNDIINTPVNGSFLGEIFYRLGSNILDDQTTGWDRFSREAAVAVMTPTRFLSRLLHGDLTRTTPTDVYQKEPLNIALSVGYHHVNQGTTTEKRTNSATLNMQLDYGNPFERRSRKPFDFFMLRIETDFGVGRKILSNVTGYGLLYGFNSRVENTQALFGLFQHMNFFDNNTFELGSIAFGPGIISKHPTSTKSYLYINGHASIMPLAGLSGRFGPDTTQTRDYNYGGGAQLAMEVTYDFGPIALTFVGRYWWFHAYFGTMGNSYIGLIRPRITARIINNLSVGLEHQVYYSERYPNDFPAVHSVRTEQRLFFQLNLEEFKFKR
jgi:hypothetical protein